MKYCFVILHYMAIDDTIECVSSILKLYKKERVSIVIIDNDSENGSGLELKNLYSIYNNIDILLLEDNIGFAKGNNEGYKFAKEKYNPKYIIVINNDIVMIQNDFLHRIEEIYTYTKFDVLGPDILSIDLSQHQNPMRINELSIKEIKKIIFDKSMYLKSHTLKNPIWKIVFMFCVIRDKFMKSNSREVYYEKRLTKCVLHGACYIFSNKYISKYDSPFNPDTFLYFEEDILHLQCKKDGKIMIYDPRIRVIHKEDAATNIIAKGKTAKNIFRAKNMINSAKVLLDIKKSKEDVDIC